MKISAFHCDSLFNIVIGNAMHILLLKRTLILCYLANIYLCLLKNKLQTTRHSITCLLKSLPSRSAHYAKIFQRNYERNFVSS